MSKTLSRTVAKPFGRRRSNIPTEFHPESFLVQKPIQKGIPLPKTNLPVVNYGQYIYLYNNIQTSQVVYSLSRHLNNKDALSQLPYLGKKTIPPRLRKDLWSPLAMIYFPSPHAGLAAYRKLREFRRLHETTYDLKDITETEGKHAGSLLPNKKRGKVLMNQKANSVADLAAVLWQQERGPSEERVLNAERRMKMAEKKKMAVGMNKVKKDPVDVKEELQGVEGVMVRWADLLDAEFAETWPDAVMHDRLEKSRHTVAWPALQSEGEEQEVMAAEASEGGRNERDPNRGGRAEQSESSGKAEEKKGWLNRILPRSTQNTTTATV